MRNANKFNPALQDCIETACHKAPTMTEEAEVSNVVTFPIDRVKARTAQVLEGAKLMGELSALSPLEKAMHLKRVQAEVQGATVHILNNYR